MRAYKWLSVLLTLCLISSLGACALRDEGEETENTTVETQESSDVPVVEEPDRLRFLGAIQDPDRMLQIDGDALIQMEGEQVRMFTYLGEGFVGQLERLEHLGDGVFLAYDATMEGPDRVALVTDEGEVLIPFEICDARWMMTGDVPSDRYLVVSYATEETSDEAGCLFSDEGTMYTGYACVYDREQAAFVGEPITEGYDDALIACGDHFFRMDGQIKTLYDETGSKVFQTSMQVEVGQGYFLVTEADSRTLYDETGSALYGSDRPLRMIPGEGGYLTTASDGGYEILDCHGTNVLERTFDEVYGYEDGVFQVRIGEYVGQILADGRELLPCDKYRYTEPLAEGYHYAGGADDGTYALVGPEGVIMEGLAQIPEGMVARQEDAFLVIRDGAFCLRLEATEARLLAPALIGIRFEETGLYGAYDLISGEQVLDTGYELVQEVAGRIYAYREGAWEIYEVGGPVA